MSNGCWGVVGGTVVTRGGTSHRAAFLWLKVSVPQRSESGRLNDVVSYGVQHQSCFETDERDKEVVLWRSQPGGPGCSVREVPDPTGHPTNSPISYRDLGRQLHTCAIDDLGQPHTDHASSSS